MEGHLLMSAKERRYKSVLEEVNRKRMSIAEAARGLNLSYRHCRRICKRFREQGDAGLVHRSRAKASSRAKSAKLKKAVLERYRQRYDGFGPTLAAEKLAKDGYEVDHETLRRWLLADGQWKRRRKRKGYRSRRERKAHFGELVQIYGSHHQWFGPDKPFYCLMNMVDDATGYTLSIMAEQETTVAAMQLLRAWSERHGIPKALYTDKKSVFVATREPTLEEQLADEQPKTVFGTACAKLGIEIIIAHSPQAKGRVERNHGVYQDRFVKELALRRITTIKGANKALRNGFVDALNDKFARTPASDVDFHCPLPKGLNLDDVFCIEQHRTVQNDWTIRHENRIYQITEDNRPLPKPKNKIVVRTRMDRTVHLYFGDKPLDYRVLTNTEFANRTDEQPEHTLKVKHKTTKHTPKPSNTPWRQNVTVMFADKPKKTKDIL
jgi:molybdenum-dependent DNA-binding transcriptional regulator ModE